MANLTLSVEAERAAKTSLRNRRASVRWRAAPATPGKIFIAATYDTLYGGVLDISVNGIGLLLARAMEIDTLVLIAVESPRDQGSFELLARVARVTAQRDGSWVVGCSFYGQLSDDELEALL